MSNLLERAIIDAKALKEAALKNAEQLVIEKYSQEVKKAMTEILEEAPEDELGGMEGLEGMDALDDPAADPAAAEGEEAPSLDPMMQEIPDAFRSDDDEIIQIKLDSLDAEFDDEEDGPFAGDDELADDEIGIDITDEEPDLDTDLDTETTPDVDFGADADIGLDITPEALEEVITSELKNILSKEGAEPPPHPYDTEDGNVSSWMKSIRDKAMASKSQGAAAPVQDVLKMISNISSDGIITGEELVAAGKKIMQKSAGSSYRDSQEFRDDYAANKDQLDDLAAYQNMEEGSEELDEEIDLDELMERVRVEGEPQKSGWAGTPESIMQEYESMLLAREQDSEVKEKNAELRKTVAELQKENKTLSSAAIKLQEQNKNFNATFETLQEKLETMNVSNAKLLYINQALENASLNERQKRKIVEAISKAGTVQEAKIVFDTMSETVTTTSDVKKEATLNEMVSRKSTLLVAARKEQPKQDANPLFNRMQTLAGIKTK